MISLKENKTALMNLNVTIKALDQLDQLIAIYSNGQVGPAYCSFKYLDGIDNKADVQFDRAIIVSALEAQREKHRTYLATLGIEA